MSMAFRFYQRWSARLPQVELRSNIRTCTGRLPRRPLSGMATGAPSDLSESSDVADAHPQIVSQLNAMAIEAHSPAIEGTFSRTDRHERDRRSKLGKQDSTTAN